MDIIPSPPTCHSCPGPSRKAELAAGIEILHKLMGEKLGNSLTEKCNYCHYFQLMRFDLCLGAGNTVMAVVEPTGENHSICSCDVLLT